MMKLLIVDDEYLVRTGIRETIDWEAQGIRVVGEAANGREGLRLAEELSPDILISDIRMPVMDGVELVGELKKRNFEGAVLILSGYNDFDYAKKTFENGVCFYLLKPVDNDELVQKVTEAARRLACERERRELFSSLKTDLPELREKAVLDFAEGRFAGEEDRREKFRVLGLPAIERGGMLVCRADGEDGIPKLETLKSLLKERISGRTLEARRVGGFLLVAEEERAALIQRAEDALREFERFHCELFSVGISWFGTAGEAPRAFAEAETAAADKLFPTLNSVSTPDDAFHRYRKNVVEALRILARRYGENVTIRTVADELYVSESYLMHLFKDNVGRTFNECLTDIRMHAAKKFLESGRYRVSEISEMVGYRDVKYFGQVFRRQTGMTPSDYLKSRGL